MRRRELLAALGGAVAAWPMVARAQLQPIPVIGFLSSQSSDAFSEPLRGFRKGLKEAGFVEGENLTTEYRWAENRGELLQTLAADTPRRAPRWPPGPRVLARGPVGNIRRGIK